MNDQDDRVGYLARRLDRAAAIAEGSTRTTGEAMHAVPKPGPPHVCVDGTCPSGHVTPAMFYRASIPPGFVASGPCGACGESATYAAADLDAAGAVCEPDAEDRGRG